MFSKEEALKIKKMVENEKVFLWKSEVNYLSKEEIIICLYSSREIREAHEKHQQENDWVKIDFKDKERLYASFHDEDKVYIWTSCFARKIEDDNFQIENRYTNNSDLTSKLNELICNDLIKNGKCQEKGCDKCINNQVNKILELTMIDEEVGSVK